MCELVTKNGIFMYFSKAFQKCPSMHHSNLFTLILHFSTNLLKPSVVSTAQPFAILLHKLVIFNARHY